MPSVFVVLLSLLTRLIRDWKLEKETRFLIEKKNQIMTSSKNSEKIAILKISSEVSKLTLVNYPYVVSICTRILKYRVWKIEFDELDFLSISNWIFTAWLACKNQFWNWFLQAKNPVCRTWFFKIQVQINRGLGYLKLTYQI